MNVREKSENEVKWKRHQKSVVRVSFFDDKSGSNHGSFLLVVVHVLDDVVHVLDDVVHDPRLADAVDVTDGDRTGS